MLQQFVALADMHRPGYSASLGHSTHQQAQGTLLGKQALPDFLLDIYSNVAGTPWSVNDQTLMDFVPGFRLIHIAELLANYESCHVAWGIPECMPFLANYSSDFVLWNRGQIFLALHDGSGPELMHASCDAFWQTICMFYTENVYTLDAHGFLTSDFEREQIIGAQCNPNVPFWSE